MSRKILCPECDKELSKLAHGYSELYESIKGVSYHEYMMCDDCGKSIKEGEECFAAVLLTNKSHPNYKFQRPELWAHKFINIQKK
jgi:uncharacterized protein with PIN domain